MNLGNNIKVIRASGVLHNLHVKWQHSHREEDDVHGAQLEVFDEDSDGSQDSESDGEDLGGPGQQIVNPNDPAPPADAALTVEQVKVLGQRHRDMIMDLMIPASHSLEGNPPSGHPSNA